MKRSDECSGNTSGRAIISTSDHWRTAARNIFGDGANIVNRSPEQREPAVTCPKCMLEFVLIFDDEHATAAATYETACPRCTRPFRFVHVKPQPTKKKNAAKNKSGQ